MPTLVDTAYFQVDHHLCTADQRRHANRHVLCRGGGEVTLLNTTLERSMWDQPMSEINGGMSHVYMANTAACVSQNFS